MTNAQKANISGKGGGFRSAHFLPMLIQIYFILRDILPNKSLSVSKNFKKAGVVQISLGNVYYKILSTIENVLHLYFELNRSIWNEELIENLDNLIKVTQKSLIVLFDCKQHSLFKISEKDSVLISQKIHMIIHFPYFIRKFGPVWAWDTPSTEAFHKIMKELYKRISKRHSSESTEMLHQVLLFFYIEQYVNINDCILRWLFISSIFFLKIEVRSLMEAME